MKSLMLLTLSLVMAMTMVSCSQVKQEVVDGVVRVAAPVVAKYGDCQSQVSIEKDMTAKLSEWFKLQQNEGSAKAGTLSQTVCTVAVGAILPPLVGLGGDQLPAAWECKLTTLNTTVLELAKEACSKLGK